MATSVNIPNGFGIATLHWFNISTGKEVVVTIGFKDTASTNSPNTIAAAYYGAMVGAGKPIVVTNMKVSWRFDPVTVLMRDSSGNLIIGSSGAPVTGTVADTVSNAPLYTTWVVSKGTSFVGRQYRGRMYPPMTLTPETDVEINGNILAAAVTTYQALWDGFLASSTLTNVPPYLLHARPASGIIPLPTPITKLTVRGVVGIQRRRRARGA